MGSYHSLLKTQQDAFRTVDEVDYSKEVWRDVVGYEGFYKVSSLGRVKSLDRWVSCGRGNWLRRGKVLSVSAVKKRGKSDRAYPKFQVSLSVDGKIKTPSPASLVAGAFIGKTPFGKVISYINDDRSDARLINLTYRSLRDVCEQRHCHIQNKDFGGVRYNDSDKSWEVAFLLGKKLVRKSKFDSQQAASAWKKIAVDEFYKSGDVPVIKPYNPHQGSYRYKNKYAAKIMISYRVYHLGVFENPDDAHRAWCDAKLMHLIYGELPSSKSGK